MNIGEARKTWQSTAPADAGLPDSELLSLVKRRSEEFDRTVRSRDLRESVAAVAIFILFFIQLFDASWLTRAGLVMAMAGAVLVLYVLRTTRRRHAGPAATAGVSEAIRLEMDKIDSQIRLLENILWWYIAPFGIGVVLTVAGARGLSIFTYMYAVVVALVSWGIYLLNRRAVRKDLRPRYNDLRAILEQIQSPTSQHS